MIAKINGQIVSQDDIAVILNVGGISYEVLVPAPILNHLDQHKDEKGNVSLITYHYFQMSQSSGVPVLVGFLNEVERDFFLQIITVSGIGPRAAVKALSKPFSDISRAISEADVNFLKTLPGIGPQKAKEIIAKLQNKVGKFGLIRDHNVPAVPKSQAPDWTEEATAVLLQLQYKRHEAQDMIEKALKRKSDISSAEELLNEIYKQRMNG
ncbi:MAG: Holliday junction branch migration protein RuvA [Candidatus Omnitrophica bacterium]|nr:Holliday junction branch migration protein RuvA [Candidatus Omnitrophota bacterium]